MENRLDFRIPGWALLLLMVIVAGFIFPAAAPFVVLLLPLAAYEAMARKGIYAAIGVFVLVYGLLFFRYAYSNAAFGGMVCYALCETIAMKVDIEAKRPFKTRLAMHFAALTLGLLGFIPWLVEFAGTDMISGLAQRIRDAVEVSARGDDILIDLLAYGLANLHSSFLRMQQAYSNLTYVITGELVLLPVVRTEILNSFNTTLRLLLTQFLPVAIVVFLSLGTLAMAMLPVGFYRRRGQAVPEPPAFEKWLLEPGMLKLALVLLAGVMFKWFTSNQTALFMGSMMATLAQVMFTTQGLAVMAHWQKKRGTIRFNRRLYAGAMAVLLYQVPLLFGVLDTLLDFRGLRPKKEED